MVEVITALIPIIVPMLVEQTKRLNLPKWLLPIASVVLGGMTEVVNQAVGGSGMSVSSAESGAMLGLAGVGVREVYDQLKKSFSIR